VGPVDVSVIICCRSCPAAQLIINGQMMENIQEGIVLWTIFAFIGLILYFLYRFSENIVANLIKKYLKN
jgi:hypothetical protein